MPVLKPILLAQVVQSHCINFSYYFHFILLPHFHLLLLKNPQSRDLLKYFYEMNKMLSITFFQPQPQLTEDDKAQDASMRDAFRKISGEDMEIDAYELQDILNAAFMKGTSGDCYEKGLVCRVANVWAPKN